MGLAKKVETVCYRSLFLGQNVPLTGLRRKAMTKLMTILDLIKIEIKSQLQLYIINVKENPHGCML